MRVLIVNKFLHANGGSETYIFQVGRELEKRGNRVEYFGMEHPGRCVGNHAESYTSNMDFHGKGLAKLTYPFKIIYSIEARKKIRAVLDDLQPDVVHLNNFNYQLTPSIIYEIRHWEKKNHKKIVLVYTAHDYQWVCPNHLLMIPDKKELCFRCQNAKYGNCVANKCIHSSKIKSLLGAMEATLYHILKTYHYVDAVICPSNYMAQKLATDSLLKDKIIVMHNFMEDSKKREKIEKKDYVLYFGRYSEEKGVKTLLEVCGKLSDIPFVFAGDGPLKEELSQYNNIKNIGFLEGEELRTVISEAKFTVFPSVCYENCPFSVMESQWFGTPVIASDIGGVPELLQNGVTGELFSPGNVNQLEKAIVRLWSNQELCEKFTDNCKKVIFDTVEQYCEKLLQVYQKCQEIKVEKSEK